MLTTHLDSTVKLTPDDRALGLKQTDRKHADTRDARSGGAVSDTHLARTPGWTPGEIRFKRAIDVAMAATLLALSFPVMVLVALLVAVTSRGGIIFRQIRIGRYGHPFTMYKFRTMCRNAEAQERQLAKQSGGVFLKIKNDSRVTWAGRFLRKYSLDELPQLVNVLRGDMSLVGPRPLLPSDLNRFPRGLCERRFLVPPGLTGLWQVSGRSLCGDARRIMFDLEYVERRCFWLDLWILLQTPQAVMAAKGAY